MKMFYIKNKKILNFISAVVISFGFLGMAKTCYALEVIDAAVTSLLGSIAQIIVSVCSSILLRVIGTIIEIAKYNSFINNEQIKDAWIIIRDICNMFFILILLVIAFATILRVETYNAKKLLPKLIIMAVLINFSRTICGLLIDASQLVMLTFVNAFTDGDGNFISLLKVDKFLSLAKNTGTWHSDDSINLRTTVAGIIIAVLFMVIATVALLAILIIFIVRVVMLWIYVVLSPLAFLLSSFPEGQKYASQWWGEFIRYLINGPVLAFFIWLALVTMSKLDVNSFATKFTGGQVEMLEPANFMHFIIAIGMLVGGLMVSQQIGGIGASWGANTVKGLSQKGIGFAKKGTWGLTKVATHVPIQYAKRAGYGAADLALEGLKRAPLISGMAIKGQAQLRMRREFAEEKDTRYMKYTSEHDQDRIIRNYSGEGRTGVGRALSFATRGQEASRQMYKRALLEKMQRGEDWGHGAERSRRKTQAMIEIARLGGHTVTAEGEDSFRDADLGKLFHEFRSKNVGDIDDNLMRDYYGTVRGGRYAEGPNTGEYASEYFRENDIYDAHGVQIAAAGPGMMAYTASRLKENPIKDLHHSQLTPKVLDAIWGDGQNAPFKGLAQIRDRGSMQQKAALRRWMEHRINMSNVVASNDRFVNIANPARPMKHIDQVMSNTDYTPDTGSPLGRSRNVTGKSKSPQVASGITGLDKIDKGRLALNFSDIGLDNLDALYVEGKDKAEIASRIRQSLSQVDENLAKTVEDQINNVNYLVLHNKEKNMSGKESRATHAHEILHGRLSSTFHEDELKSVWNSSISETVREKARQKVKKVYGNDNMSEDAIMHEYFTEGLTNKTRWAVDDPEKKITLDSKAEEGLDSLLKSKGSNMGAFTSNLYTTRPTKDDIKHTMAGAVDSKLQKSMAGLASAIESMGNGLDAINSIGGSFENLDKALFRNNINLENNIRAYKNNSDKLDHLANKVS